MAHPVFQEFAKDYGGSVDELADSWLFDLSKAWKDRAERRIRQQCQPGATSLVFGFLRSGDLNAVATTINGTDLIGINLGTVCLLEDLFYAMFAEPKAHSSGRRFDPLRLSLDLTVRLRQGPPIVPGDHSKLTRAKTMTELALTFVFQHEFAHVFNGHVGLIQLWTGMKSYHEIERTPLPGLSKSDLQTMEWDADCFGMTDLLAGYVDLPEPGRPCDAAGSPNASDCVERLFNLTFAVYAVFRVFAAHELNPDPESHVERVHPPAFLRAAALLLLVLDCVGRSGVISRQDAERIYIEAAQACETLFQNLGAPAVPDTGPQLVVTSGMKILQRYNQHWKLLRPQLDMLKRGGTLAT